MASIKSLLQATVKQGAQFALPKFDTTGSITYTLHTELNTFVMPNDGYLYAFARGANLTVEAGSNNVQGMSTSARSTVGRVVIPVRKGQTVSVGVWCDSLIEGSAILTPCEGRT